jgi:hypothetical protein
MAGTCMFCVCTDDASCEGGCCWANDDHTVCSLCAAALTLAELAFTIVGQVGPRARPPIPLEAITWDALTFEQQQLLVMACRRTVESQQETLIEILGEDAVAMATDAGILTDFLEQHFPGAVVDDDEPLSAVVIRLLTPHVEKRIVLAGEGPR